MKFLDLNGLKHLLGKLVKYDKGGSDVSNINNLAVNKIKTTYIQAKGASGTAPVFILFPDSNTIVFKAGDIKIALDTTGQGLHLIEHPLLESLYPEETKTFKENDLFITLASILYDLRDKGIVE